MGFDFNADEILRIAERIEINGANFYRKAAEAFEGEARELTLNLADMEGLHQRTFAEMRKELSAAECRPPTFDPDDESADYLQAFADGEIFDVKSDPSETLTGEESPRDVIRVAMALEKDSVVFYLGIERMLGGAAGHERLRRVIEEEMNHLKILGRLLARLNRAST